VKRLSEVIDISVTRDMTASAEQIYTAFTAPLAIEPWFGPVGWSVEPGSVVVEPRPYGRYRIALRSDNGGVPAVSIRARILELVPARLVVVDEHTAENRMHLRVQIDPIDEGRCRVTIHQGPCPTETADMAAISWESALAKLQAHLRPRTTVVVTAA
jgi:uncharacterized protein YndB with AHSA1/START domain